MPAVIDDEDRPSAFGVDMETARHTHGAVHHPHRKPWGVVHVCAVVGVLCLTAFFIGAVVWSHQGTRPYPEGDAAAPSPAPSAEPVPSPSPEPLPSPSPSPLPQSEPVVIMVSFDGFRHDYLDKADTPHLDALVRDGVRVASMTPIMPSKTFPNHYSLVTGLTAENHGIVSNSMWDEELGEFRLSSHEAVRDGRWWGGEPLWNTVRKAGVPSAALFWPGSEAEIGGLRATYVREPYAHSLAYAERVAQVMAWLDLPAEDRPRFVCAYFEATDDAGHAYGPDSEEVVAAVERLDGVVGDLVAGVEARGLTNTVNFVFVSDHGMASVAPERSVFLDDHIDVSTVAVYGSSPAIMLRRLDGAASADALVSALNAAPHITAYVKADIPDRWALKHNPRTLSVLVVAELGWSVGKRSALYVGGGAHGYDNTEADMGAYFVGKGPAFVRGARLASMLNLHVYELVCHILGVPPAANDGDLRAVQALLSDTATATAA